MPQLSLATVIAAIAALALTAPASAAAASAPEKAKAGAEGCLARPLPQRSSSQTVEIRTLEGDGASSSLTAHILWKQLADGRHSARMRLLGPPEVADMSVLVREVEAGSLVAKGARGIEVFLYLPELRRVRRVSVHQATTSLFGTAFSYDDFDRLHGQVRESRVETRGIVRHAGRRAYQVEAHPPTSDTSTYTKIHSLIDVKTCLPLRVEFHDAKGQLSKVLHVDPASFERVNGIWIARVVHMESLSDGMKSELIVRSIEFDGDMSDDEFAPANLADEF